MDSKYFQNEIDKDLSLTFIRKTNTQPGLIHSEILDSTMFTSEILGIEEDWFLFIHGDSKTYEQAVMRGFDIQHLHDVNVIVFSWPSKDPAFSGVKNFKN